jgi:acetyl esterase
MIDPAIVKLLETLFRVPENPPPPDIAQMRAWALESQRLLGGPPEPVASVRDTTVPGDAGPIRVRIYRADAEAARPFLYAHGGGWVTGSLDSSDILCRRLANRLRATLVAVDYRLAPEHSYPAALDDVDAAWRWIRTEIATLGADPSHVAVVGDSSGGNLVAALTLRLRARGDPQPAMQVLLYPALDATCSAASSRRYATGCGLTAKQMAWYWDQYIGGAHAAGAARDDAELSPVAARDVSGLARAVIAVAEADVLHDDGVAYANHLTARGVPVETIECAGMIHGFLRWTGTVPAARTWLDTIAAAVRP